LTDGIYEQRGLPAKPETAYMDQSCGVVVKCEGKFVAGLVGVTAFDHDSKVIKK
jgi:hypothetical protein